MLYKQWRQENPCA